MVETYTILQITKNKAINFSSLLNISSPSDLSLVDWMRIYNLHIVLKRFHKFSLKNNLFFYIQDHSKYITAVQLENVHNFLITWIVFYKSDETEG